MADASTAAVMDRYFGALGTAAFPEAVDAAVSWTVMATGRAIVGAEEVGAHLVALHGAMVDTRTRDLVVAAGTAVLEGDAATPGRPDERIPFCVVYEVRGGRVAAMRVYGALEDALGL